VALSIRHGRRSPQGGSWELGSLGTLSKGGIAPERKWGLAQKSSVRKQKKKLGEGAEPQSRGEEGVFNVKPV